MVASSILCESSFRKATDSEGDAFELNRWSTARLVRASSTELSRASIKQKGTKLLPSRYAFQQFSCCPMTASFMASQVANCKHVGASGIELHELTLTVYLWLQQPLRASGLTRRPPPSARTPLFGIGMRLNSLTQTECSAICLRSLCRLVHHQCAQMKLLDRNSGNWPIAKLFDFLVGLEHS